jgi:hypothetical protein
MLVNALMSALLFDANSTEFLGESSLAIHVIDSNKAATFVWHSLNLSPDLGPVR